MLDDTIDVVTKEGWWHHAPDGTVAAATVAAASGCVLLDGKWQLAEGDT